MDRFSKFAKILSGYLNGFRVKFKDESALMKFIGKLMFFNKAFMTRFVTTIGYIVYFPSRVNLETRGEGSTRTLAHEYRHAKDAKKFTRVLFSLLYLFPQILAVPGAIAAITSIVWIPLMIFGVLSWSWWLLPILLTLLFAAPIPAPPRAYFEFKGYSMSLFAENELMKERGIEPEERILALYILAEHYNKQFTGSNYYFMWPFGVEKKLKEIADKVVSEEILKEDDIYPETAEALRESKE